MSQRIQIVTTHGRTTIEAVSSPWDSGAPSTEPLDVAPGAALYRVAMAAQAMRTGELARRAGTTRKALRLYESAGLITPMSRTAAGYRMYRPEALELLNFVLKARRVGFTIVEIRDILGIRRAGRAPCDHVRHLIERKVVDLDRTLVELAAARKELRALLKSWRPLPTRSGTVCGHIERLNGTPKRR